VDPRNEVGEGGAFRNAGGDLLLRPYGADIADLSGGSGLKGNVAHLFQFQPETVGDDLHEAAASGSTLVVHDEIGRSSCAVDANGLAVLAADVDDGPGLGKEV